MAERTAVIYGAGAVGGFLGAHLAVGNPDLALTVVGRQRVVDAVHANGLIVREHNGAVTGHPIAKTEGPPGPVDLVMLTVRADDVARSIDNLRGLTGTDGLVVAFQNGVGPDEMLASALGRDRVLAGTLTVSVSMDQPGVVTRLSRGGGIALAAMDDAGVPDWVTALFQNSGLPTVLMSDYRAMRWSKLLLNMLGAPLTAILDIGPDAVAGSPELFRLEQMAFREATVTIRELGVPIIALPGYPVPLARFAMQLPRPLAQRVIGPRMASARNGRAPSMRTNLERGRSEIAYLNGAVVAAAKELGHATPVNAALTEVVQDLMRHPEHREIYRGRPDVLLAEMRRKGIAV